MDMQTEPLISTDVTLPVLDARQTVENIGFDVDLYRSIVELYVEECSMMPDELIKLLAGDDLPAIEMSAHTLKGVLANLGSCRFMELAREIQDMIRSGSKPESSRYGRLVGEQARLLNEALEKIDWDDLERFCEESDG
jgi:HPt (histidine-containing phosphotransfer) domain-containing protein